MFTYSNKHIENGDTVETVAKDGKYLGTVRTCRTGDFHAVTQRKGKLVSRYYGTKAGAARWLAKQHA